MLVFEQLIDLQRIKTLWLKAGKSVHLTLG